MDNKVYLRRFTDYYQHHINHLYCLQHHSVCSNIKAYDNKYNVEIVQRNNNNTIQGDCQTYSPSFFFNNTVVQNLIFWIVKYTYIKYIFSNYGDWFCTTLRVSCWDANFSFYKWEHSPFWKILNWYYFFENFTVSESDFVKVVFDLLTFSSKDKKLWAWVCVICVLWWFENISY